MTDHLVLSAGTWSMGKTSLLDELANDREVIAESGREIARETSGEFEPLPLHSPSERARVVRETSS